LSGRVGRILAWRPWRLGGTLAELGGMFGTGVYLVPAWPDLSQADYGQGLSAAGRLPELVVHEPKTASPLGGTGPGVVHLLLLLRRRGRRPEFLPDGSGEVS
jgi:hypothetical protein